MYIITTSIYVTHENVYILLLSEMMYNRNVCCYYILSYIIINKYCNYTRKCICHYTRRCIMIINISVNMKMYFYYTRRCIMTTNISIIQESVFVIIQDDV